jgi:hypothetical protein
LQVQLQEGDLTAAEREREQQLVNEFAALE